MRRSCIKPLAERIAGDIGRAVGVTIATMGIFSSGMAAAKLVEGAVTPAEAITPTTPSPR